MSMLSWRVVPLVICLLALLGSQSAAEPADTLNPEAADMAAELIGAPVFTVDGSEIGQVHDVAFDDELRPARLRIRTKPVLGRGMRIISLPNGSFTLLRGAVLVHLPIDAIRAWSDVESDGLATDATPSH
jgi:PRC-barrel domain